MLFATITDEYKFLIHHHPRLSPGQKKQCIRFLTFYKDGIEICERYLAIEFGEVEVVQEKKGYIPFWKKIATLLMDCPGLTRRELAKIFEVHHTSINNSIGKGLRRGIFKMKGERVYVIKEAVGGIN